jgi:hypothetical protein
MCLASSQALNMSLQRSRILLSLWHSHGEGDTLWKDQL